MGKLPATMTAIAISEPGGPMVLKPEKRPLPEPKPGEILIRVRAAGVNRPDVLQRQEQGVQAGSGEQEGGAAQ